MSNRVYVVALVTEGDQSISQTILGVFMEKSDADMCLMRTLESIRNGRVEIFERFIQ